MSERFAYDEQVYRGRIIDVRRVGVRMPDGNVAPRDLVHYPGAAVILPVLADGRVAMIRNVRFAVNEELWELPAGVLDDGEDPAVCARRELTEETGYTCGRLEKLGQFYAAPGTTDEMMYAFVAFDLVSGPQRLERYEEIKVEPIAQDRLRQMVLDGAIHDGKTIATLALYWLREGRL